MVAENRYVTSQYKMITYSDYGYYNNDDYNKRLTLYRCSNDINQSHILESDDNETLCIICDIHNGNGYEIVSTFLMKSEYNPDRLRELIEVNEILPILDNEKVIVRYRNNVYESPCEGKLNFTKRTIISKKAN